MKKSLVAGIAGSVRCIPLTLAELYHQERHGKRLDQTSKGRVVTDDPPLTTTGLDLRDLYAAHVDGCFIPKGKTKVIHAIIQWPKDLVDLTDEQGILDHGIAFAKSVWGEQSILATRYDRDERSKGVVDVFLVPRYRKYTQADPGGKLAVSITKHGKDLAKRLGRMTGKSPKGQPQASPWDVGMALQDELYTYMRDVMRLKGVARGQSKARPGSDWKSSEQLRTQELDEKEAGLNDRERKLEARQQQIEIDAAAAQAESKKLVDDAEQVAQKIILGASERVPKWKADAEAKGREVGYAAGFEYGQAKLEKEQDAAREATQAAEQKDRDRQKALDAAMDERRQAEMIRNEAQRDAVSIRAKAKQEAAEGHKAMMQRQTAVEAGLEALLKGEILQGGRDAEGKRKIFLSPGLAPQARESLTKAIMPAWDWLSQQAARLSIINHRAKVQEAKLDRRESSINERERSLNKTGLRQEVQKRKLAQGWEAFSSLMEKTTATREVFQATIAPLTEWRQRFQGARGPVRQVMEAAPQRKIAEAALAEPTVQAAQATEADYQAQLATFNAMKQKWTGVGE